MNGVEILNQYQVAGDLVCNDEAAMITFLLCLGILTVVGVFISVQERELIYAGEGLLVGIVFGFLLSIIVSFMTAQPGETETHYKVTIDDSVSLNEFRDKYEIIDQEGKIYTVKEKK